MRELFTHACYNHHLIKFIMHSVGELFCRAGDTCLGAEWRRWHAVLTLFFSLLSLFPGLLLFVSHVIFPSCFQNTSLLSLGLFPLLFFLGQYWWGQAYFWYGSSGDKPESWFACVSFLSGFFRLSLSNQPLFFLCSFVYIEFGGSVTGDMLRVNNH